MANTVEVEGLKELRRSLKAAGMSYDDLKAAGLEAADVVAATARTLVPHLSGALESTIRPAGQAKGAVVRSGGAKVPYAGVIHFGWPKHGIQPHPFLYDAVDQRADEIENVYLQRVQDIANTISN